MNDRFGTLLLEWFPGPAMLRVTTACLQPGDQASIRAKWEFFSGALTGISNRLFPYFHSLIYNLRWSREEVTNDKNERANF